MSLAFFDLWLFYLIWAWMFVELPGIASPAQSRTSLNRDLIRNNMKHHETKSVLPKCFVCVDICSICLKVISFLKPRLRLSKFSGAWYFLSCLVMGEPQCSALESLQFQCELCPRAAPLRWRSFKDSFIFTAAASKKNRWFSWCHARQWFMLRCWLCLFFPNIQTSAKKPHIGTSRSVSTGLLTFRTKHPAIHPCESRLAWSHWARYWPRRLRLQGEGQHSAP